eukprot:TRINITY_DN16558_c0_g1_i1.p1 TRINITY_DN16558_c0_g1~~TRINITY_DN16558_c0_g1_i1.p1  ORF type:complete len:120 (-),score=27.64 TRINITY_DN16558_c0_g1_i1:83-409(-)
MVLFCPTCANVLYVEKGPAEKIRFFCRTCPYVYNVEQKIKKELKLLRKEKEFVLGEEEWANAATTSVRCTNPSCDGEVANFMEIQIRSADEPATIFYRCTECGFRWNV